MSASRAKKIDKQKEEIFFMLLGSSVFLIGGLVFAHMTGLWAAFNAFESKQWPEVPCRVISAELDSDRSSDGRTTYEVNIVYNYDYNGKTYRSDQYHFLSGATSEYEKKAQAVQRYRTTENPVCYVNPDKPSEAILVNGFQPIYLFGLIPLLFTVAGIAMLIFTVKKCLKERKIKSGRH